MMVFLKHVGALFVIATLAGCAAPTPATFKEVESKSWLPGNGPLLSEIVKLQPEGIKEVALRTSALTLTKEKFESDSEFEARKKAAKTAAFLVAPLKTSKADGCESTYDRESLTYKVGDCLPFRASRIVLSEESYGTPFSLANAYDSRTIQRKIVTTYRVLANVDWKAEYKLRLDDAKLLDGDLMAGIVMDAPYATHDCELCKLRETSDSLKDLSKSLAAINGRSAPSSSDWKDRAFKEGEVLERWDYVVRTGGFSRVIIFRKSDQRVLSDRTFARVSQ